MNEAYKIKLSIIVVTMNHLGKLKNLLRSLYSDGGTGISYEIILVDNCSSDGTVEFVKENYPDVIVTVNEKIHGFAANNNKGYNLSKGEYVFICNPDIILLPAAIDTLVNYAELNPSAGIICPKLLNSDHTFQHSVRSFMNIKIIFMRVLHKGNDHARSNTIDKYLLKNFDRNSIQPVDWAIGAAYVMKRSLYTLLAGFDENFFLYVEDVDLCLRCWKEGYSVIYDPEAVMIHDHQRASFSGLNKKTWYHLKSMRYFLFKHKFFFKSSSFVDGQ
jgi:N-acetylglucosaminyl-diphospho-decaprenol L-rhamnosyltransferase